MRSTNFSAARARARASTVLQDCFVTRPEQIDLGTIAYLRNVIIEESELSGADGRLVVNGSRAKARVNSRIAELGKRRFVAAHELGHFELHSENHHVFNCDSEYFDLWRKRNPTIEREANHFAAELLMPEEMVKCHLDNWTPTIEATKAVASTFRVSLTATSLRLLDLTCEDVIVVSSQKCKVQWRQTSPRCEFKPPWSMPLSKESYAWEFFQGRPLPAGPQEVPAVAWFPDHRLSNNATIWEDSIAMPNYGVVLSLLWIREPIEASDNEIDPQFTPDGRRYGW